MSILSKWNIPYLFAFVCNCNCNTWIDELYFLWNWSTALREFDQNCSQILDNWWPNVDKTIAILVGTRTRINCFWVGHYLLTTSKKKEVKSNRMCLMLRSGPYLVGRFGNPQLQRKNNNMFAIFYLHLPPLRS